MKMMKGTVLAIIDLWRQYEEMQADYRRKEERGELKEHHGIVEAWKNPITHKLHCVIANLDPQVRGELVALMWLGREGGTKADFEAFVKQSVKRTTSEDASYLSGKQRLDEILIQGMEILGM